MQPADVLGVVEQIAAEALRAGAIIRRLRSLIRKEDARHEWTNLNDLATDAVRLLASDLRQSGVTVRYSLGDMVRPVHVDSIQIEQVLLNLLRNAIDAMADVPLERREIHIATKMTDDELAEVSVSDQGTGLASEVGDTIFDPFVSTKPNGLGLGLSISRTIIETHGGRLWARPNPGGGTIFTCRLPIQAPVHGEGEHAYRRTA
jgi:two-component system sensor kinase FixL